MTQPTQPAREPAKRLRQQARELVFGAPLAPHHRQVAQDPTCNCSCLRGLMLDLNRHNAMLADGLAEPSARHHLTENDCAAVRKGRLGQVQWLAVAGRGVAGDLSTRDVFPTDGLVPPLARCRLAKHGSTQPHVAHGKSSCHYSRSSHENRHL